MKKVNKIPQWFQHLFFWVIYLLLWSIRDLAYHPVYLENVITNVITGLPYPFLVYVNLYFLIPKLLLKKKYVVYLLALSFTMLVCTSLCVQIYRFLFNEVYLAHETAAFFTSMAGKIVILTELLVLIGISMALFFLQEWYQKERYAKELEKKQLESELAWLKHQINPHFLFNTLNTIYMLVGRNAAQAKLALEQFSDILSHQLYDTRKDHIELTKEIEYLKSYIALASLRHEDLLSLKSSFPEKTKGWRIAPMLLLPFVENAFKHGGSSTGYWIDIRMEIVDDRLNVLICNSINIHASKETKQKGGIGLNNVQRRLHLLYPNQFSCTAESKEDVFEVALDIPLIKQVERHSQSKAVSNKMLSS